MTLMPLWVMSALHAERGLTLSGRSSALTCHGLKVDLRGSSENAVRVSHRWNTHIAACGHHSRITAHEANLDARNASRVGKQ
jgi:hypothetical protein